MADEIAILAAPGKLLAQGSPVSLKSRLGEGYVVPVTFASSAYSTNPFEKSVIPASRIEILQRIRQIAADSEITVSSAESATYLLRSGDVRVVAEVLDMLEAEKDALGIEGYDVHGATLEEIFLRLMATESENTDDSREAKDDKDKSEFDGQFESTPSPTVLPLTFATEEMPLTDGIQISPWAQALVMIRKRWLIHRRSWMTPLCMVIVSICGPCVPLFFMSQRSQHCNLNHKIETGSPLYLPTALPIQLFLNKTDRPTCSAKQAT